MRKASGKKWVVQLCTAIAMSLTAFSLHAQLMLAHEGHHAGHGGCQVKTGDFPVTVSIYEVPEGNIPPMHSYCDHVPNVGKVNVTIELPADAREIPLAVRLVKEGHDEHGGHGGAAHGDVVVSGNTDEEAHKMEHGDHNGHDGHGDHAGHNAEEQEEMSPGVGEHYGFYMPSAAHPSGIIVVAAELKELGQYAVLLEKVEGDTVRTAVRVPVYVGKGGGHAGHGSGFGMLEMMLLLAVVGGLAYYFILKRKSPNKEVSG
jgi:hypothetical protein